MKANASALLAHLTHVQAALEAVPEPKMGGLAGGAFLELDSVLVTLNKQRLAAKKNHARLAKDFGLKNEMVLAAADQLENFEVMYMQRLAQLRRKRESSEMIREAKQKMAQRREAARQQTALAQMQNTREEQALARREKRSSDFWFMLMMFFVWQAWRYKGAAFKPMVPRLAL